MPTSPNASSRPIGPYERRLAVVRPWDPRAPGVAGRLIAIIRAARPDLDVEHIGSTAVPPAEIPAITQAMHELGFGPQPGPDPWPPSRPMHVGSVVDGGVEYRIHFHVHPRGAGDLAKDLRFRDALRADPALRDAYATIKAGIVGSGGGSVDAVRYQAEKGIWILDEFDRLGIPRPRNVQGGPAGEDAGMADDAGGAQ